MMNNFGRAAGGPDAIEPPLYLMTTIDPDIAMVALENYIVATNSREQRGRAIRALADFMAVHDSMSGR
ncbi:hypothetical protein ACI6PP_22275 [Solicola sp. PLA-1-18]